MDIKPFVSKWEIVMYGHKLADGCWLHGGVKHGGKDGGRWPFGDDSGCHN